MCTGRRAQRAQHPLSVLRCRLSSLVIVRNGVQLYTVDMKGPAGTDHLSPVVMIHGFGMGLAFWARQLDDFAKHRRVIAFDLPGMGCSDRPAYNGSTLKEAEDYFIGAIYDWQKAMGIRASSRNHVPAPHETNLLDLCAHTQTSSTHLSHLSHLFPLYSTLR